MYSYLHNLHCTQVGDPSLVHPVEPAKDSDVCTQQYIWR